MKNEILHLQSQRAKRPREQHLRIDTRIVDAVILGASTQIDEINRLMAENAKLKRENVELKAELKEKEMKLKLFAVFPSVYDPIDPADEL